MRVAKEWARGKIAAHIRRVWRLGGKHFRGHFLVHRARVGCDLFGLLGVSCERQRANKREGEIGFCFHGCLLC